LFIRTRFWYSSDQRENYMASAGKIRDDIDNAIKASGEVKEGNYITVSVEKKGVLGFGGQTIVLSGRVTGEKVMEAVTKIAAEHAGGLEVANKLRIGKVS
jgi:osmotically-inducible protein OsmY